MRVETLDYHTAGEPLRIVTAGLPDIPGESMLDRRSYMQQQLDNYRRFLMLEPRGHADMYGAVITVPATPDGDVGVLFLHNEGYSTMCGHGIIALVTAGLEHQLFSIRDPQAIRIDTPAGRVTARANLDQAGRPDSVTFENVPSFVFEPDVEIEVDGLRFNCTVAFGGAFYAYVDAAATGFELRADDVAGLIRLGRQIKHAVNSTLHIRHPEGDPELNFLYGTIFVQHGVRPNHSRNVCIFANGELDRSPTGTGVSGRAAIHYHQGEIELGDEMVIEGILGTAFRVRCTAETRLGDRSAVITEVTGSAWQTGRHEFTLDARDPLHAGFMLR